MRSRAVAKEISAAKRGKHGAKDAPSRLVVVSNRVPDVKDGRVQAGGLAVALDEALQNEGGLWFGWSGKTATGRPSEPKETEVGPVTYVTMDLSRKDYNEYYNGFANRTLWPLFHYRLDLTSFRRTFFSRYQAVNELFAEKLSWRLKENDRIWVHDYHLLPLGECLRRRGSKQTMGIFLHTPFPAMEVLTYMPAHRSVMKALAAYDLIGFQTDNDMRAFTDYIEHEAGGKVSKSGQVEVFDRTFQVGVFPIGINPSVFERPIAPKELAWARKLREQHGDKAWMIGVDRLDYSKGILERFQAFERMLERYPGFRNQVSMFQITPPSRGEVAEYKEIRHELETSAGHINGRFADIDWVPINYINKSYTRDRLTLFFRASRVGLVTPLRDGMNLVAKEFVAAQNSSDPGVLVLSRFAGAARELKSALIVNPYDTDEVAEAMARGLEMPLDERLNRREAMMKVIRDNDLDNWRDKYLAALANAGGKR